MGLGASFKVELPEKKLIAGREVLIISPSAAYNIMQLCVRRPVEYVLYDVRPREMYLAETLRDAIWGWESNVDLTDQRDFHKLLRDETEGRQILIFGDRKHSNHISAFINNLALSKSKPLRIFVLRDGIASLMNPRYKEMTVTSNSKRSFPLEIIAPSRPAKGKTCVLAGAAGLISHYLPAISFFEVTLVINVSREAVVVPNGVAIEDFNTASTAADLIAVSNVMDRQFRKRKSTLILDDTGSDNSMACILAFICSRGHNIEKATEFVKSKNFHADENYLQSVYAALPGICSAYGLPPPTSTAPPANKNRSPRNPAAGQENGSVKRFVSLRLSDAQMEDKPIEMFPDEDEDFLAFSPLTKGPAQSNRTSIAKSSSYASDVKIKESSGHAPPAEGISALSSRRSSSAESQRRLSEAETTLGGVQSKESHEVESFVGGVDVDMVEATAPSQPDVTEGDGNGDYAGMEAFEYQVTENGPTTKEFT